MGRPFTARPVLGVRTILIVNILYVFPLMCPLGGPPVLIPPGNTGRDKASNGGGDTLLFFL